jgi:hypothetical protein
MIWYYYDESNVRFRVESFAALKKLALRGVVKPDTIIENEVDKKSPAYRNSPAYKFQGLKFAEEKTDESNSLPEVSEDAPVVSEGSEICKFAPFRFTRRKSLSGITDNFMILTIYCFLLLIIGFLALWLGCVLELVGLIMLLVSIFSGAESSSVFILLLGMYCILSSIPIFLSREIIMLFLSMEQHIRYQTNIMDDIIDSRP